MRKLMTEDFHSHSTMTGQTKELIAISPAATAVVRKLFRNCAELLR
jgi:hypothetical protein